MLARFRKRSRASRALRRTVKPTGVERRFGADEIIVSKTDRKGVITYANDVFLRVAGYCEAEVLGQPHSLIRHPDMPRCVFKLLWDKVAQGDEIFAYVVNLARNGDHYWVLAHVTPDFDAAGSIVGYHSNRRVPRPEAVADVAALYRELSHVEQGCGDRKQGLARSTAQLEALLAAKGIDYDRFVLGL